MEIRKWKLSVFYFEVHIYSCHLLCLHSFSLETEAESQRCLKKSYPFLSFSFRKHRAKVGRLFSSLESETKRSKKITYLQFTITFSSLSSFFFSEASISAYIYQYHFLCFPNFESKNKRPIGKDFFFLSFLQFTITLYFLKYIFTNTISSVFPLLENGDRKPKMSRCTSASLPRWPSTERQ